MLVERYNVLKLSNAELSLLAKALDTFINEGDMGDGDFNIAKNMMRQLEDRYEDPANGDVRMKRGDKRNIDHTMTRSGHRFPDNRGRNGNRRSQAV